MKSLYKNKLVVHLILILFLFLGIIFDLKYNYERMFEVDIEAISGKVQKLQEKSDILIKNSIYPSIDSNKSFIKSIDKLKEAGIELLIFKNDSLVYWSDNYFEITSSIKYYSKKDEQLVKYGNTWFLKDNYKIQDYTFIPLILLKTEYEIKNNYLSSNHNEIFNINGEVNLSSIPESDGYEILDKNDEFLFTIIPDYKLVYDDIFKFISAFSYMFFLVFLLIVIFNFWLKTFTGYKKSILFIGLLLLFRILFYLFNYPTVIFNSEIFSPHLFAISSITPSLGDFILNCLLILLITIIVIKYDFLKKIFVSEKLNRILLLPILIFSLTLIIYSTYIITLVVKNSSINLDFNNLLNVNLYSLLVYLSIVILFFSVVYFVRYLITSVCYGIQIKVLVLGFLSIFLISLLVSYNFRAEQLIYSGIIAFVYLILFEIIKQKKNSNKNTITIIDILFFSLFIVFVISNTQIEKEKSIRKLLVSNLATERDLIAEMQMSNLQNELESDLKIKLLVQKDYLKNVNELYNYILTNFFHGYWSKYDFQLTVCKSSDTLFIESNNHKINCIEYFKNYTDSFGTSVPNSNFNFLDNSNGRISYLGILSFSDIVDSSIVRVFLELDSKLIIQELGYPDLLLDSRVTKSTNLEGYSYSKYKNNVLVNQFGDIQYKMRLDNSLDLINLEMKFADIDGISHLYYKNTENSIIILSRQSISLFDYIVYFSYVFLLFILLFIIYKLITNKLNNILSRFVIKLQITFIGILSISMIIIGGGTIIYNVYQFEEKQLEKILEKAQSILIELDGKLSKEKQLTDEKLNDYITYLLVKFSNVFFSDINLYNVNGKLISSSRYEVFDKLLIGTMMNPNAYFELTVNRKTEYVHKEKIGDLEYISAYVPLYNDYGELIAYVNLPYFTKESILRNEITSLIVTIVNIFMLVALLTIIITVIISNQITRPLRMIQKSMSQVQLGKSNIPILYQSKDEIGELVVQYNRLINEIEENAEKLARSERESAWRNMARQIAHEIKNPLTPMKLNIQFLMKTIEEQKQNPNWKDNFNRICTNLIEQINVLSEIASEFSAFAQMPKTKIEQVDVKQKLLNAVSLFKNEKIKIQIIDNSDKEIFINFDNEQILRVFNNVINNAIQAVDGKENGELIIYINDQVKNVLIEFRDNGVGISEEIKDKIFTPNFTTKTSGMGLGLAMVKNLIDNAGGKIWFETKINVGTSFYLEFKK